MIGFANAKINIGLNIIHKRADEYHQIETLFYPIPLYDLVEIIPNKQIKAGQVRFIPSGLQIPGPTEDNICIKAYHLISESASIPLPGIDLYLYKNIPFGAGLGGGSSDAVQVILLLNKIFQLNLSFEEQNEIAKKLGADCPFFLRNEPCFATGIGEILEKSNVSIQSCHLVLVKPGFSISTKEAFKNVSPKRPETPLQEALNKPIREWKSFVHNDFEIGYQKSFPEIEQIKQTLYDYGAAYASLSGSGSCVFGLFEDEVPASIETDLKEKFNKIRVIVM